MSAAVPRSNPSLPPATLGIMAICGAIYASQVVLDLDLHHYTMNPRMILYLNEYYRCITSSLFHGSLMHIGFNLMSTAAISTMLEKRMGTLQHAFTIAWSILLTSAVYTLVALVLSVVFRYDNLMYQHSVGFSGVLFHLTVMECNLMPNRSRSVFGFISVPAFLYPWALLVVLQVIMPNLSFVGHLSGVLTGTLQAYGVLDALFVSEAYLQEMEKWPSLAFLTTRPNFVATPVSSEGGEQQQARASPASLQRALGNGFRMIIQFLKNVAETLVVCIFGRGSNANDNIQLWQSTTSATPTVAVDDGFNDDDNDWVGLPPMPNNNNQNDVSTRLV